MPTWIRSFLLYALLLLGMSWALPASASPGTCVGCCVSSKAPTGGEACTGSYPYSPTPLFPSSPYNLSHWIHWSSAPPSSAAASFTTPSSVILRAVGALATKQCSGATSPSAPMYCHEVTTPSDLVTELDKGGKAISKSTASLLQHLYGSKIIRLVPGSPVPPYAALAFGFKSIDDFVFPHPIQVCTDASRRSGDGYVTEPSNVVKSECTKTGAFYWVCHSSFATKLSEQEKKARKAEKQRNIRALEKSMKKHGVARAKYNNCDLHHIVPNDAHGDGFDEARELMDKCGIDLNNYRNGVYLPGSRSNQGNCQGGYNHKSIHTEKYAKKLRTELEGGYGRKKNCDGLKKALQKFKEKLQNGSGDFPKTD